MIWNVRLLGWGWSFFLLCCLLLFQIWSFDPSNLSFDLMRIWNHKCFKQNSASKAFKRQFSANFTHLRGLLGLCVSLTKMQINIPSLSMEWLNTSKNEELLQALGQSFCSSVDLQSDHDQSLASLLHVVFLVLSCQNVKLFCRSLNLLFCV